MALPTQRTAEQQAFITAAYSSIGKMKAGHETLDGGSATALTALASSWGISISTSTAQAWIDTYKNNLNEAFPLPQSQFPC